MSWWSGAIFGGIVVLLMVLVVSVIINPLAPPNPPDIKDREP